MIEGMKFHVKGDELASLLAARAVWHREKAIALQDNLKQAEEGMKAASEAAMAAGSASPRRSFGGEEVYMTASAPRRTHGGNVEDPVAAIRQAIVFHYNRSTALEFYSKHVVLEASYVLNERELQMYELVVDVESIEG